MSATVPAADFGVAALNLWLLNGISNNDCDKNFLKSFTSVSGLSTEALLQIGAQVYAAPAATFSALGTINGQAVTTAATYEDALLAAATGNRDNLKCGLIFEPYIMQNIYSDIAAYVVIDEVLGELVSLGQEAEVENSFVNVFNVFCNL